MHPLRTSLVAALSVFALLVAHPAAADPDDAIVARVRQALVAARLPDAADIKVSSFNGEVDLGGVVRSERIRDEAARLAGIVRGVTAVRNGLEVRQPSGERDTDDVISSRVRAALIAAAVPGAQDIRVTTFNGDVDLGGVVDSDETRVTAAEVAGVVRGVTAVRNGLTVRHP
jgi:osmotically-inducible protein OsmY